MKRIIYPKTISPQRRSSVFTLNSPGELVKNTDFTASLGVDKESADLTIQVICTLKFENLWSKVFNFTLWLEGSE